MQVTSSDLDKFQEHFISANQSKHSFFGPVYSRFAGAPIVAGEKIIKATLGIFLGLAKVSVGVALFVPVISLNLVRKNPLKAPFSIREGINQITQSAHNAIKIPQLFLIHLAQPDLLKIEQSYKEILNQRSDLLPTTDLKTEASTDLVAEKPTVQATDVSTSKTTILDDEKKADANSIASSSTLSEATPPPANRPPPPANGPPPPANGPPLPDKKNTVEKKPVIKKTAKEKQSENPAETSAEPKDSKKNENTEKNNTSSGKTLQEELADKLKNRNKS